MDDPAEDAVARVFRDEWGRIVATLIRTTGDWDLAEECAQDAFARALERWPRDGVPANPGAWLTTTARNRALDRLRRAQTRRGEGAGSGCPHDPRATVCVRRQRRGRRPAPADLHLLSPGAVGRGAGGAYAAHARRPHDRRDRAARSSCPRRRWRSAWCGRSARSTTPASRTACRRHICSRNGQPRSSPCCTSCSTRGTRRAAATSSCAPTSPTEAIRLARTLTELMPDEPEPTRCSRSCCSTTPGGPAGSTPTAISCCSKTRTAARGTGR